MNMPDIKRELVDIEVEEVSLVDSPAIGEGFVVVKSVDSVDKAVWTTAFINSLPDSHFLYVRPGGQKKNGQTIPKSLRMFPYKDSDGKVDLPHLRNALARIPQSDLAQDVKDRIKAKAAKILARENKVNKDNTIDEDVFKDETTDADIEDAFADDPDEAIVKDDHDDATEHLALAKEKLNVLSSAAKKLAKTIETMDSESIVKKLSAMSSVVWGLRDIIPAIELTKSADDLVDANDLPGTLDKMVECVGQLSEYVAKQRTENNMADTEKVTKDNSAPDAEPSTETTDDTRSETVSATDSRDVSKQVAEQLRAAGYDEESISKALNELRKNDPASQIADLRKENQALAERIAALENVGKSKAGDDSDAKVNEVEKNEDIWGDMPWG